MHKRKFLTLLVLLTNIPAGFAHGKQQQPDFGQPVTLSRAIEIALNRDPRLSLNETAAESAEGRIDQAGLRPNPVVGTEIENIAGTGPFRDIRRLEVTLGIRQLIETADKRERRENLARRERELVDWERELIVADIEADVRRTFIDVLSSRKSLALRREQLALAERSKKETARLVESAHSSRVELSRAKLAARRARLALERAERGRESAHAALAALWNMTPAPDFEVAGELVLENSPPPLSELAALLPQTASLARYEAVDRSRETALKLEQARAKPDFEIFARGRYFNENNGDAGFTAGVEIPWPLFDKNRGDIRSARARARAVDYERQATRQQLLRQLSAARHKLVSASEEARAVKSDLLPAAEEIVNDTEAGYANGRFSQLAVLESRRNLLEAREAYLDALSRYTKAKTEIKALTRPAQFTR